MKRWSEKIFNLTTYFPFETRTRTVFHFILSKLIHLFNTKIIVKPLLCVVTSFFCFFLYSNRKNSIRIFQYLRLEQFFFAVLHKIEIKSINQNHSFRFSWLDTEQNFFKTQFRFFFSVTPLIKLTNANPITIFFISTP